MSEAVDARSRLCALLIARLDGDDPSRYMIWTRVDEFGISPELVQVVMNITRNIPLPEEIAFHRQFLQALPNFYEERNDVLQRLVQVCLDGVIQCAVTREQTDLLASISALWRARSDEAELFGVLGQTAAEYAREMEEEATRLAFDSRAPMAEAAVAEEYLMGAIPADLRTPPILREHKGNAAILVRCPDVIEACLQFSAASLALATLNEQRTSASMAAAALRVGEAAVNYQFEQPGSLETGSLALRVFEHYVHVVASSAGSGADWIQPTIEANRTICRWFIELMSQPAE